MSESDGYVGNGEDGVYIQVEGRDGLWFATTWVDCNSSHFTETLINDDGPYTTYDAALEAGKAAGAEWCIINGVNYE